jgi:HSP20 family molecular chaperone IbpA
VQTTTKETRTMIVQIQHPEELRVGDTRMTSAKDNNRYRITTVSAGADKSQVSITYSGDADHTYLIDQDLCPFDVERPTC